MLSGNRWVALCNRPNISKLKVGNHQLMTAPSKLKVGYHQLMTVTQQTESRLPPMDDSHQQAESRLPPADDSHQQTESRLPPIDDSKACLQSGLQPRASSLDSSCNRGPCSFCLQATQPLHALNSLLSLARTDASLQSPQLPSTCWPAAFSPLPCMPVSACAPHDYTILETKYA